MRRLIIGLLIACAIFVVGDFGIAAYSEYQLSTSLRERNGLASDPEVTLHGFPFIWFAVQGKVPSVEIRARGVNSNVVHNNYVEAHLSKAQISGKDLLSGNYNHVKVESILGRMRIDVTQLGQSIGIPDLEIVPPTDNKKKPIGADDQALPIDDGIVFAGTVKVGGASVKVNVRADLFLSAGALRLVGQELLPDPDKGLPKEITEADRPAIISHFSTVIDHLVLPYRAIPRKAWTEGTQIVIEGSSSEVEVSLDSMAVK